MKVEAGGRVADWRWLFGMITPFFLKVFECSLGYGLLTHSHCYSWCILSKVVISVDPHTFVVFYFIVSWCYKTAIRSALSFSMEGFGLSPTQGDRWQHKVLWTRPTTGRTITTETAKATNTTTTTTPPMVSPPPPKPRGGGLPFVLPSLPPSFPPSLLPSKLCQQHITTTGGGHA